MSEQLKPCPFCGGEAKLNAISERIGYGEYERHDDYHQVKCLKCDSGASRFRQRPLIEFTEHTVSDFRKNPVLRAKVEDDYEAYCEQTKQLAIEAWNRRADVQAARAAPEEFVIVPKEPTQAMCNAARIEGAHWQNSGDPWSAMTWFRIYRAMIAAAPIAREGE